MADHVYHFKHGWIPLDHEAAKTHSGHAEKAIRAAHTDARDKGTPRSNLNERTRAMKHLNSAEGARKSGDFGKMADHLDQAAKHLDNGGSTHGDKMTRLAQDTRKQFPTPPAEAPAAAVPTDAELRAHAARGTAGEFKPPIKMPFGRWGATRGQHKTTHAAHQGDVATLQKAGIDVQPGDRLHVEDHNIDSTQHPKIVVERPGAPRTQEYSINGLGKAQNAGFRNTGSYTPQEPTTVIPSEPVHTSPKPPLKTAASPLRVTDPGTPAREVTPGISVPATPPTVGLPDDNLDNGDPTAVADEHSETASNLSARARSSNTVEDHQAAADAHRLAADSYNAAGHPDAAAEHSHEASLHDSAVKVGQDPNAAYDQTGGSTVDPSVDMADELRNYADEGDTYAGVIADKMQSGQPLSPNEVADLHQHISDSSDLASENGDHGRASQLNQYLQQIEDGVYGPFEGLQASAGLAADGAFLSTLAMSTTELAGLGLDDALFAATAKERKQAADKGQAMSDGSYPIRNRSDLTKAVRIFPKGEGNGKTKDGIKRHIVKRARALNAVKRLPDSWGITAAGASIINADDPNTPLTDDEIFAFVAAALTEVPPTEVPEGVGGGVKFRIPLLVPTGVETGDRRKFKPGGLTSRDFPMPLYYQTLTDEGHKNSVIVARIDNAEKVKNGIGNAVGEFDTGEHAQEALRLIRNLHLRGVSADMDKTDAEATMSEEDGKPQVEFDKARLTAGTLVGKPAFAECQIELPGDEEWEQNMARFQSEYGDKNVKPLVAAGGPVAPPSSWFENPGLTEPTHLTVLDDGRVFGHIAAWGIDHIGMPFQQAPRSASGYRYFSTGQIKTAEGDLVNVGQLTLAGGHADTSLPAQMAIQHYDDTNSAVADVAIGEDQFGIWVAGAQRPDLTEAQVRQFRASDSSGDWRPINGNLELVACCQVNCAGFPIPRARVVDQQVMALTAAGAAVVSRQGHAVTQERLSADEIQTRLARLENIANARQADIASELRATVASGKSALIESTMASLRASAARMATLRPSGGDADPKALSRTPDQGEGGATLAGGSLTQGQDVVSNSGMTAAGVPHVYHFRHGWIPLDHVDAHEASADLRLPAAPVVGKGVETSPGHTRHEVTVDGKTIGHIEKAQFSTPVSAPGSRIAHGYRNVTEYRPVLSGEQSRGAHSGHKTRNRALEELTKAHIAREGMRANGSTNAERVENHPRFADLKDHFERTAGKTDQYGRWRTYQRDSARKIASDVGGGVTTQQVLDHAGQGIRVPDSPAKVAESQQEPTPSAPAPDEYTGLGTAEHQFSPNLSDYEDAPGRIQVGDFVRQTNNPGGHPQRVTEVIKQADGKNMYGTEGSRTLPNAFKSSEVTRIRPKSAQPSGAAGLPSQISPGASSPAMSAKMRRAFQAASEGDREWLHSHGFHAAQGSGARGPIHADATNQKLAFSDEHGNHTVYSVNGNGQSAGSAGENQLPDSFQKVHEPTGNGVASQPTVDNATSTGVARIRAQREADAASSAAPAIDSDALSRKAWGDTPWSKIPADYRSTTGGVKRVLVNGPNGTTLVPWHGDKTMSGITARTGGLPDPISTGATSPALSAKARRAFQAASEGDHAWLTAHGFSGADAKGTIHADPGGGAMGPTGKGMGPSLAFTQPDGTHTIHGVTGNGQAKGAFQHRAEAPLPEGYQKVHEPRGNGVPTAMPAPGSNDAMKNRILADRAATTDAKGITERDRQWHPETAAKLDTSPYAIGDTVTHVKRSVGQGQVSDPVLQPGDYTIDGLSRNGYVRLRDTKHGSTVDAAVEDLRPATGSPDSTTNAPVKVPGPNGTSQFRAADGSLHPTRADAIMHDDPEKRAQLLNDLGGGAPVTPASIDTTGVPAAQADALNAAQDHQAILNAIIPIKGTQQAKGGAGTGGLQRAEDELRYKDNPDNQVVAEHLDQAAQQMHSKALTMSNHQEAAQMELRAQAVGNAANRLRFGGNIGPAAPSSGQSLRDFMNQPTAESKMSDADLASEIANLRGSTKAKDRARLGDLILEREKRNNAPATPAVDMSPAAVRNRVNEALRDGGNGSVDASHLDANQLERALSYPGDYVMVKPSSGYETNLSRADAEALLRAKGGTVPTAPKA